MSNKPIQDFNSATSDEQQFERLLRLVAALQASSPDSTSEEALIHQCSERASPTVLKMDSLRREIELRAYHLYVERGRVPGWDMNDWLQAEMELREKLGLGRGKAIMRLALAWGLPGDSSQALGSTS